MRRRAFISLYLCILAAWIQLIAPVAAMSMDRPVDPFSIICTKSTATQNTATGKDGAPLHHHRKCDHCLLCHAYLGGSPLNDRPVYTAFDFPVASPLRWTVRLGGIDLRIAYRESQPRAPPPTV